ncbi:hypothetical protein TNIN_311601 [Trichonephila inaurata madagascariensis]|uniref:Protein kinase domain-containing protein n=1 Tax=Trichonephila inaurata madagascariensis TaxID=2747483 RepID=A0A8X6WTH8_9ARAC|nr:hypothetical protein TNIN_311601 [Trichonephila inaurata madagascariensis]
MVNALKYLHGLNIAHRDLKCENIMIDDNHNIKLIDFGFCRSTVDAFGRRKLSETFCGSTAYAAPEVLQGLAYNPMMYDVWSLGCVLYIMTTGMMPFDDSHIRKMVTNQLKRHIKFPSNFQISHHLKSSSRPDGMFFKVKEDRHCVSKYMRKILGIDQNGRKEVLGFYLEESEGANFWLGVLNNLKGRRVEDILIELHASMRKQLPWKKCDS